MQTKLQSNTIGQLLGVLTNFKQNYAYLKNLNDAYQKAIQQVANKHKVTYQTIGDLCRRRLGLRDITEFQNLLKAWVSGDDKPLIEVIIKCCYVSDHKQIEEFFSKNVITSYSQNEINQKELTSKKYIELMLSLDSALYNKIQILAQLENSSINIFISKTLTEIVEVKSKELINKLISN